MATDLKSTTESSVTTPRRLLYARIVQNFHLVWLDPCIDETSDDYRNSITKLREVVNTVTPFVNIDDSINFIKEIQEKAFVIISGKFDSDIISVVQNISQVHSIYVYNEDNGQYEKFENKCSKVAGLYTDIASICEALKEVTRNIDRNSVSISYLKTTDDTLNTNLDTLDPTFMYTQILKEILLTIKFEQVHFNEFIIYCRKQFDEKTTNFGKVNQIEKKYHPDKAIQWYTNPGFLYPMLNRALRTMEADLIVNMGFFVRDLHNQIAKLHTTQYSGAHHLNSFIVYRGQSLSQTDFDQLKATQGGLMSFNNFLSTTRNRDISLEFAKSNRNNSDMIGVLFKMTIDPSVISTPFANIEDVSDCPYEEEILFSMHSVFRIGQVKQIEGNDRLWQVELTLTSDNDPQLQDFTKVMQKETEGSIGWFRLGRLMMKVANFNKAEQLFEMLLGNTTDETEKSEIYYYLGWIKKEQANYTKAITYYKKSLNILQETFGTNHPKLTNCYNNIGVVYLQMGQYPNALLYYEKALKIRKNTLPANHLALASSYSNIGMVYHTMENYPQALSYYEMALEIKKNTLLANDPDLAISYNNIGGVYDRMDKHSEALSYYKKTLEIEQKTLPPNHPDLATSYNNIGMAYDNMKDYSKALSYYERAVEIERKTLPEDRPNLAKTYENIGVLYTVMHEDSKALSYYEKVLKIRQNILPENHPDIARPCMAIGLSYATMSEYSKAFSYLQRALRIWQCSLPDNDPLIKSLKERIEIIRRKLK